MPRPRPTRQGQPHRLLRCKTCKARFSERNNTPLFDSRLPPDKALALAQHLAEGGGVRPTGRLVGVNKNTVVRYALRAGGHAQKLHDELVAVSPQTREVQLDEQWSFVGKKQKHCDGADEDDRFCGDQWDFVALDPASRLVLGLVVGKRIAANAAMLPSSSMCWSGTWTRPGRRGANAPSTGQHTRPAERCDGRTGS